MQRWLKVSRIYRVGSASYLREHHVPLIFDLPEDYDQVFVQVLVGSNIKPKGKFETNDPSKWFLLPPEYIGTMELGGVSQTFVKLDHTLAGPEKGGYHSTYQTSIACTRSDRLVKDTIREAVEEALSNILVKEFISKEMIQKAFIKALKDSF